MHEKLLKPGINISECTVSRPVPGGLTEFLANDTLPPPPEMDEENLAEKKGERGCQEENEDGACALATTNYFESADQRGLVQGCSSPWSVLNP